MKDFTFAQKRCIEFFSKIDDQERHLLIEAGAGAGKTSVIAERLYWLLRKSNDAKMIDPSKIFILTFSKDAANQLSDRIKNRLEKNKTTETVFPFLHISTIDSLFSELVNCIYPDWWEQNFPDLSMPSKIELVHEAFIYQDIETSLLDFLKESTFSENELSIVMDFILSGGFKKGISSSNTLDNIIKMMSHELFLSTDFDKMRIPSQEIHPSTFFLIQKIYELARLEYQKRVRQGKMTFADKTTFLKENLNKGFPIKIYELIVDEYQDTNDIQHEILFALVNKNNARMVVVGDPKQSIYGFRHADVEVFKKIKESHQWKHFELKDNFRSEPSLLQYINEFSEITFSWKDPDIPENFLNSSFYQEAKKKYVSANNLSSGKRSLDSKDIDIYLVLATLREKSKEKKTENKRKINLKEHSFHAFCDFIRKFKEKEKIKWSDCVILCERNSDIHEFSDFLDMYQIPFYSKSQTEDNKKDQYPCEVGLALAKCLLEENDKFDLYHILQSPLYYISHDEIELYFINNNVNPSHSVLSVLNWIEHFKPMAKDNFFKAWQLLRWQLVESNKDEVKRKNAGIFCAGMDQFAKALNLMFSHYQIQSEIANKLEKNKTSFSTSGFLPFSIDDWNLNFTNNISYNKEDYLEIKTVHSAKGLEWHYVFFMPMYGNSTKRSSFLSEKSGDFFDIIWLHEDPDRLSVIKKSLNSAFNEQDKFIELDKNGHEKKTHWFAFLRRKIEQDFERQRVFYTAFTRAEKKLILLQPIFHHASQGGILDEFFTTQKKGVIAMQKNLEKELYLQIIHKYFTVDDLEKMREKQSFSLFSRDKKICLLEYGMDFYQSWSSQFLLDKDFIKKDTELNKQINSSSESFVHSEYFNYGPTLVEETDIFKKEILDFDEIFARMQDTRKKRT